MRQLHLLNQNAVRSWSLELPLKWVAIASALCLLCVVVPVLAHGSEPQKPDAIKKQGASSTADTKAAKPEKTAYDYQLPGADGKAVPLTNFKGKYILVVNLGRKSTYNAQLPALIKDYEAYKDKGLIVIGIPSDDFGASEPGTDAEIQKAYADAKVTFPVMAVSKLTGDKEIPLYIYLTKSKGAPAGGEVHWNFTKFVIDKNGKVVARLDPDVTPDSTEMISTIEQILDGRYKPKNAKDGASSSADDDDDE